MHKIARDVMDDYDESLELEMEDGLLGAPFAASLGEAFHPVDGRPGLYARNPDFRVAA